METLYSNFDIIDLLPYNPDMGERDFPKLIKKGIRLGSVVALVSSTVACSPSSSASIFEKAPEKVDLSSKIIEGNHVFATRIGESAWFHIRHRSGSTHRRPEEQAIDKMIEAVSSEGCGQMEDIRPYGDHPDGAYVKMTTGECGVFKKTH